MINLGVLSYSPGLLTPTHVLRNAVIKELGLGAGLLSRPPSPFVSTMNPPPQIGSRVCWWNHLGQLMHGTVESINVLSDNSHVVVIRVDAGQHSTVSLPLDHVQPA